MMSFTRFSKIFLSFLLIATAEVTGMNFTGNFNGQAKADDSVGGHVPQEVTRLNTEGYINAVAWNADGSRLATVGKFGSVVTLFETKNWTKLNQFERYGGSYAFNSLEFLFDNTLLTATPVGDYSQDPRYANTPLTDSRYNRLDFFSLINWNPEIGKVVRYFPDMADISEVAVTHTGTADTFTVSRDGSLIAGINGRGNVLLYNVQTGALVRKLEIPALPASLWSPEMRELEIMMQNTSNTAVNDRADSVAFFRDEKILAVGTTHGFLHIFDISTGTIVWSYAVYPDQFHHCSALAYSPDGSRIAVGKAIGFDVDNPNDIAVTIIDTESRVPVATLQGTPERAWHGQIKASHVYTLSWSPQGNLLAIGDSQSLRLWRVFGSAPTLVLDVKIVHGAFKTAFSPQGVLAATDNNQVVIYK